MKILIIDDDNFFTLLFEQSIKNLRSDCEVITFENGKKGLDYIVEKGLPDIIFLDLNMPVMDGFIFLQNMGKRTDLEKTKIYMVSAVVDEDDKKDIEDIGIIEELLTKPVEEDLLMKILK